MPFEAVCKFAVDEVTATTYGHRIKLVARYDSELPEDRRFSVATPDGEMRFLVTTPGLAERFKPGQSVYIRIELPDPQAEASPAGN